MIVRHHDEAAKETEIKVVGSLLPLWRFVRRSEREALVQLGLVVHTLARPRRGVELGGAARRVGAHCLGGCHGKLNLLKPAKGQARYGDAG
jgi:hypothetical protein